MPQEISISYQATKSKVYRLIDAMVDGEKTEAEVQESIRRWWNLVHPEDRPAARKFLLTVLGRSVCALDAIEDAFTSSDGRATNCGPLPSERVRGIGRIVENTEVGAAV